MFRHIPVNLFEERTGISKGEWLHSWTNADRIVSLRQMEKILSVISMPMDYLKQLLASVFLEGNPNERPYCGRAVRTARMDPANVVIGQTFVERPKYTAMLENFQDVFGNFCVTKGIAKLTAMIVLGRISGGLAVAHYVPPIVEQNGNHSRLCLMDGIHRNFLVRMVGTTIETIVVEGVEVPFPCDLNHWESIRIVQDKPPREERFFSLKPELFRDLKSIGIDG